MKKILLGPVVTEKSMSAISKDKYTFFVDKSANKAQIEDAVAKMYKVKILKVNIIKRLGKVKKYRGRVAGRTKNKKIALIRLVKGQKIADFSIKE